MIEAATATGPGPYAPAMTTQHHPILVIGGGNMGRAILEGAARAGVIDAARTVVVDPDASKHGAFEAIGASCTASGGAGLEVFERLEASHGPGIVLLAVKPQMLEAVETEIGDRLRAPRRLVLSILAGVTAERFAHATGGRAVRLMPNTPAQIGLGLTAMCAGPGATDEDLATTRRLFEAVGSVIELDEDLLDAFTGVAGSGPAYIFYLAEGMAAGAEAVGFDRTTALRLARDTIAGAAGLLQARADIDPGELRAMVTSKNGTTAAATAVLDARAVGSAVRDAIVAARDRGRELAGC